MPTYFAFLRAINVGGRTVRMEVLRQAFEKMGLAAVRTFISSGNVIFDTDARDEARLEQDVEAALERALGYEVTTFLRSAQALERIATRQPFQSAEPDTRIYVAFLKGRPPAALRRKLEALSGNVDELKVGEREIYWLSRTSLRDSNVSGARLEAVSNGPATVRNVNTVNRLLAKYVRSG
jgi:uncharacterized protein (DUF1697 family)